MNPMLKVVQARQLVDTHLNHVMALLVDVLEAPTSETSGSAIGQTSSEMVSYHLREARRALDSFHDAGRTMLWLAGKAR